MKRGHTILIGLGVAVTVGLFAAALILALAPNQREVGALAYAGAWVVLIVGATVASCVVHESRRAS